MKKNYESPEFEVKKLILSDSVLTISQGEGYGGGGVIEEPTGTFGDDW